MGSPTQRSLAKLRKEGYIATIVERWNHRAFKRHDAFGFGDILACHPEEAGAVLIQTTTHENLGHRMDKVRETPEIRANASSWLAAGNRIEFHGWRALNIPTKSKDAKNATRKSWRCEVREFNHSLDGEAHPITEGAE